MNRISNYDELAAERRMIEARIAEQKAVINQGVGELRSKLEPFLYLLPLLNVFKKKESGSSLLKFATSAGIDLLVGQKLLSKSNWLMKLLVPMFLKGISAKAIGREVKEEA